MEKKRMTFSFAGGLLEDKPLQKQSPASLRAVLSAKVAGSQNLLAAVHCSRTTNFAAFSSIAALLGNAGQANYAAANAAMEAHTQAANCQVRKPRPIHCC